MNKRQNNNSIVTQSNTESKLEELDTDFHYSLVTIKTASNFSQLHYHNLYEIYFLEEGKREYIINGKIYEVEPGNVVIIPPGVLHGTEGSPFTRKLVHFSRKALSMFFNEQTVNDFLENNSQFLYIPDISTSSATIDFLFQRISYFFSTQDFTGCVLTLGALLHHIQKMKKGSPKTFSDNKLINQILLYIHDNATKITNLDEIAKKFFISKYRLCHFFKQQKGITVYDYILKIKTEKAASLLISTNKKIKDICFECGFNSEYYFSKRFRIMTGISPSRYRKQFFKYHNDEKSAYPPPLL